MAFKLQPGRIHRMPTAFGPVYGPRSGVGGRTYENLGVKNTSYSVSFLTDRDRLEAIVPPGFRVRGEPVVTVAVVLLREVEWLAGRGYNLVSVSFPAAYDGEEDHAEGSFMPVLWENMADPIITGREEIGWSKIYADIPEPRVQPGGVDCTAEWMGFRFLDLHIEKLTRLSARELEEHVEGMGRQRNDGVMHHKYMPRTGALAEPDVCYPIITPSSLGGATTLKEMWRGEGTTAFHEATWEDLPTQVDIVNTLHELGVVEYRGAQVTRSVGTTDLSATRILG